MALLTGGTMSFVSHLHPETLPASSPGPLLILTIGGSIERTRLHYSLMYTVRGWEIRCREISMVIRRQEWHELAAEFSAVSHRMLTQYYHPLDVLQHRRGVLVDFEAAILQHEGLLSALQR